MLLHQVILPLFTVLASQANVACALPRGSSQLGARESFDTRAAHDVPNTRDVPGTPKIAVRGGSVPPQGIGLLMEDVRANADRCAAKVASEKYTFVELKAGETSDHYYLCIAQWLMRDGAYRPTPAAIQRALAGKVYFRKLP
jgi:hypothetical protein